MTNYKKIIFTIFLAVFSISGLITPRPANAFPDLDDISNVAQNVWEVIEKVYDEVQGIVGAELSNRTVGMFLDSVAYDVATQIAEGGPGGKPQFRTKSIKANYEDAGKVALGEFLGQLTEKGFDELGINLCDPSIELKLTLTLGLIDKEAPPEKSLNRGCSWNQLKKNWADFDDNVQADIIKFQLNPVKSGTTSTIDFFKGIASRESSDLGIAFELEAELNKRKLEAEKVLELTTAECQGYIDNKKPITEEVITHCSVNEGMTKDMFTNATKIEADKQLAKKQAAEAVPLSSILKDAGNKFLNTFTSKLMKNWIKKGMWSLFGTEDEDLRSSLIEKLRGGANIRQPRGADIFKQIKTVNIEGLESFDYISDFTICPDQFRRPDNCVMSPAFLQAINNKVTLRQAVEQGIIDGDMPFVNKNDSLNNTVMKCYRDALCESNLVKLRKANIVPVGWELAASRAPVSLQQAMDCFEDTDDKCSFKVPTNAESPDWPYKVDGNNHNPFYHLVDPDWVMKAPDVRCDAYGYSDVLESPDSGNRQKYCADPKVCLREDSDGNCLEDQFSYCTRSENIWNFEGDACLAGELYAGCLNFSNKDFGKASYIQDTLDYCNSNEAGCRRYSQYKDAANNWTLEPIDTDPNDLFLNNQAAECNGSNAGCSEYIVLAPDMGVNLVRNGSFDDLDGDNWPDGWSGDGINDPTGINSLPTAGLDIEYDGDRVPNGYSYGAGGYPTTERVFMRVDLQPNTIYVLSAEAAQYDIARNDEARIVALMCDENNDCAGATTPAQPVDGVGDCILPNGIPASGHDNSVDLRFRPDNTDMERHSCSFMTNDSVSYILLDVLHNGVLPSAALWFDNIKLEIVNSPDTTASTYSDYGVGAKIYMDATAVMCTADEVGCQGYRPSNGDPMIPAVITQDDLCPAECLNYDTFTEQIDDFDIIEGDLDVEYYNFIPDTARECPDQEIGCEEFTNLDVVAQGGEGREYFTYLRQCVEEDLGKVFYTWEGTEVAGYQIKTWYALPGLGGAPCTNMAPAGSTCLDVNFVDDGFDDINEIAACDEDTLDTSDDIENDSNCREFFDVDGNVYYRLQDRIIFATNNCHDYRRTETSQIYKAVPEESIHCAEVNNGCRAYYGNNANNVRVMISDNFEGGTYSPWTDSAAGPLDLSNVALQNNGHSLLATVDQNFVRDMTNNPLEVGKTYKISWWMMSSTVLDGIDMDMYVTDGPNSAAPSIMRAADDSNFANIEPNRWHQYTITTTIAPFGGGVVEDNITAMNLRLWPSASLDLPVYIDNFTIKKVENSFAVVRNSWNTPVSCDDPYDGYYLGCQLYADLNKQEFNLKSFDHLCREEAIGCLPVIDTKNSTNPFEETFGWYCSDPAIETEGACSTAGETWLEDYSSITVEADSLTYLVPDPNNYCSKSAKGCTALGVPDRLDETKFSTVYKLNDPDKYNSILCSSEGLNCAEYNSSKGSFYFKDPGANTCTYQQNTLIENNLVSGWFKTSTLGDFTPLGCADTDNDSDSNGDGFYDLNELILPRDYCSVAETNPIPMPFFTREDCESTSICIEDATQNQVFENQADCEANALYTWSTPYWNDYLKAAQCPVKENLCTSFKDPVDPIDCDPKGRNIDFVDYKGYCINGLVPTLEDNLTDCEDAGHRWVLPSKYGYCDSIVYNNKKDCESFGHNWTDYCKDYYYYDNNKIDSGSCNGLVNRQDGCVLFYDANDWDAEHNQVSTIYDANETYENVEVLNLATSPVACNPEWNPSCVLSSNRIIKVSKDRQCAEWLACKSSAASYNPDTEDYKIICDELGSCIDFQYDPDSNTTKCKKWGSFDETNEALTIQKYQSRDTGFRNHISWSDKEYIGYSIPNLLPISELSVLDFGDGDSSKRLIYNITDSSDGDGAYFEDCVVFTAPGVREPLDGESCTTTLNRDGNYYFKGECKESICWLIPEANQTDLSTYGLETRVYAKVDAPFPAEIEPIANSSERIAKYDQANICTNIGSATNSCELSFKEVSFGSFGETKYYYSEKIDTTAIPTGICTSGVILEDELKGTPKECAKNKDCDSYDDPNDITTTRRDGMCSLRTEEINFKNWPGICLEYDYDITVTRDGENSYHCNQWYPVEKIKGTSSLYDNYNLAGYSEPNGRDALFCAVAEPHITTEDRVYCVTARGDNCTRLVRVPAGARIDMEGLNSNQEIVFRNYIRDDAYYHAMPDDININTDCFGIPNSDGLCNTYGLERIENAGPGAYFNLNTDFEPQGERATVYSLGALERTFDTSHDGSIDIEIYYFDQDVNFEGSYNGAARIQSTKGFAADWGPETRLYERQTLPVGWQCGDHYDYVFAGYPNDLLRRDTPGGDYHMIYDTGIWKCENRRFKKDKHCRTVQCNPGPKNYYVKAVHPVGPWRCEDDNCSTGLSPQKGLDCIETAFPVDYTAAAAMADISECGAAGTDPECEFLYCVIHDTITGSHNDPAKYTRNGTVYTPENNVTYCSDFGYNNSWSIEVPLNNNLPSCYFDDTLALEGCFQYLYDLVPGNMFVDKSPFCLLTGDSNNNNALPESQGGYSGDFTFNRAILKSSVNPTFVDTVLGVDPPQLDLPFIPGCLSYDLDVPTNASCSQETRIPDMTTWSWSFGGGLVLPELYPIELTGGDCDGLLNDRPLNCYQQCRVLTRLDSEGDLSTVRTDIWWRNKKQSEEAATTGDYNRIGNDVWQSYYWNPSGDYVLSTLPNTNDDDVLYGSISAFRPTIGNYPLNFSHFGAGLGIFSEDKIFTTRVPYHKDDSVEKPTAATFFASYNGSLAVPTLDTVVGTALDEMQSLFVEVYNLEWNGASYDFDELRPTLGGNGNNPFATLEYSPRILAVCGEFLCETLDADNNVTAVTEGISVNGITSGTLQGQDSSLFVSVKFFYHAHPDRMPVTSVNVAWGDNVLNDSVLNIGKYTNSLPDKYCDPDSTAPGLAADQKMGFGGTSDACRSAYKVFYHDYLYDATGAYRCDGAPAGEPNITTENASCYQPSATVYDNWGESTTMPFGGWVVVYED